MKKWIAVLLALILALTPVLALAEPAEVPETIEETATDAPEAEPEAPAEGEAPDPAEEAPDGADSAEAPAAENAEETEDLPVEDVAVEDLPSEPLPEAAALPAVGEVACGFEVVDIRDFPLVGATLVTFEHQRTGAKVMYIANDDTNRAFNMVFRTQAIDNTGLPHVFEHATLSGSEKYPSKALWFNLTAQTYNTFMNAMTGQSLTMYPIASLSEAQLLKLADFYVDSCLHPMVMEDESIYREEAWRYRMDTPESDLTLEGTVYSEMLGATTLDRASLYNARRSSVPGSYACNDSGGSPDFIPDMTFESLCSYHDLYYHPSNSVTFLYGQYDDYTAFLKLLDDAFAPYERREFKLEDPGYTPIAGPVVEECPFPVEAGSDTRNGATVCYVIVCPGLRDDPEQAQVMNLLTDLLSSDTSSMAQAMRRELPTASFGAYIETDAPDYTITFMASHINREDAEKFRGIVDSELEKLADAGSFPEDMIDAEMASLELTTKLIPEQGDLGVNMTDSFASMYVCDGDLYAYPEYIDALGQADEWNREGRYGDITRQWLIGSSLTALVTTYPEPGLKEQKDAELAAKLADIKANMPEEELNAIVEASVRSDEEDPGTAAMVDSLQAVTVESLPEEYREYEVSDEIDENGVRHVDALANVDGVGNVGLYLDAAAMPQEDLYWLHLYIDLIGELDTDAHTREELDVLQGRYLYGKSTALVSTEEGDDYHRWLQLSWIAMDEDLDEGYDLMYEIAFETRFDNPQDILDNIADLISGTKQSVNSAPYSVQARRAFATSDSGFLFSINYSGLGYYAFLLDAEQLFTDDPEAGMEKLRAAQRFFHNGYNAVACFAGNADSIALNRPLADAFMAKLDHEPIEPASYDFPVPDRREGLIVDSAVQYNLIYADFATLGLEEYTADMDVVVSVVQDIFLLPLLRDQYGAYGVLHSAQDRTGMYIVSYRDPNVTQTFDVYDQLPDLVAGMTLDQATLDRYIISAYTGYALPVGELSGAMGAITDALNGDSQDEVLEDMRALKAMTPEKVIAYADVYRRLAEDGVRSTSGGASAINANADLYNVILNPFSAVDKSEQDLADVGEDSEYYEAVRYVYENGMMAPLEDDRFGVDEPATVGDLAVALLAVTGETLTPEEAVAAFVQYGLLWDDATPDEPIAGESCDAVLSTFAYMVGAEYPGGMVPDTEAMTRGQMAKSVYAFMTWLETADIAEQ